MGFFKKLFRRKNGNSSKNSNSSKNIKGGKDNTKNSKAQRGSSLPPSDRDSPTMNEDPILITVDNNSNALNNNSSKNNNSSSSGNFHRSPTANHRYHSTAGTNANTNANAGNANTPQGRNWRGPDVSDGGDRPILKQRTSPPSYEYSNSNTNKQSGPVDLDQSDVESSTSPEQDENHARLSQQRLEEFTQQQQQQQQQQPLVASPVQFHMPEPPRFSAGHVAIAVDDSDGESSSFNLSTDAEDTEYEDLKKRGVLRKAIAHQTHANANGNANSTSLDMSTMSQISIPSTYNTDGETSVFPMLPTDDEGTERESLSGREDINIINSSANTRLSILALNPNHATTSPMPNTNETQDQPWQDVPSVANNPNGFVSGFDAPASSTNFGRRNFTSPKSSTTIINNNKKTDTTGTDSFGDFADFANFSSEPWPDTTHNTSSNMNNITTTSSSASSSQQQQPQPKASPTAPQRSHSQRQLQSSSAALTSDTSLSELLAQAKSKRSSHRTSRRSGSNSVNSAPAISASYLRQHHGLKSSQRSHHNDGTSVTDIIKSLEADNASRHSHSRKSSHRRSSSDVHSTHSRDGHSVRSAKERLRRRRESERRRSSRSPENDSSDSEDDAESWLMDEVTGALGPRGIAADLESLSGRSNRSRSSGGGRSHKSHRSSSHRSSRNRRRHKSGSGESVDSHGSRRSRSSRYSHRSARSYISTMSEQSRSVANDLLRLEMQLAMVNPGSNGSSNANNNSTTPTSESVRSTRSSRSGGRRNTPRRSRITVVAPPGKLGIILANKADSRGTVVSGVRTSSVLADQIAPGDRIVAIDGEDVSIMTVSEITTIMARKAEFERTLSVLTTSRDEFRYRK